MQDVIHGTAWQITYPSGYCSKLVSRWDFRFSLLSQRKMNKGYKTPTHLLHHRQLAGDWIYTVHTVHSSVFLYLFCYKGEFYIDSFPGVSHSQMLGSSSSQAGHMHLSWFPSQGPGFDIHSQTLASDSLCFSASWPESWPHLQSLSALCSDRPKFSYFHQGLSL